MTTVLTPVDLSAATQTGPRVYRKQVLAKRSIDYPMPDGSVRRVVFDDAYLTDLAAAFRAGAYDHVPFQLATPENKHNEDPRNYGGRVIGAEVTPEGLDVIVELAADTAELVERTGRRLGVSARIKEKLDHVDGRSFKRAIRHVLGTLDPRMQNLKPWEPVVDLSATDDDDVVDLSAYTFQGDTMGHRRIDASRLSDEQLEQLESFAAINGLDLSVEYADGLDLSAEDEDPEDDEPDLSGGDDDAENHEDEPADEGNPDEPVEPMSEDELDALLEAALAETDEAPAETDEPVLSLSDDEVEDMLDLAGGMVDTGADEVQVHRNDAADARFQLARERYGREGVPPYLLDLARPILECSDESDVLELSSPATGDPIDVRGIVVGLLDAFRGTVDLSTESGHGHDDVSEQQEQDTAARWTAYLENN